MGNLYIVATPIGNLEDITIRAIKTLFFVDYIACEDTRKTGQLLKFLKEKYMPLYSSSDPPAGGESRSLISISSRQSLSRVMSRDQNNIPQLISYYDEIEFKRIPEIIKLLEEYKNIALVSDAGTPLISDPGFKLVRECIKRGIQVISIPGPSSVITGLTSSGLPPNIFLFLGYLPSNQNKRKKLLSSLQQWYCSRESNVVGGFHPTVIFFETSHRLMESLSDLKEIFGDIEIVICRELTKIYEEIWRGKISKLPQREYKGELVLLFTI